ERPRHVVLAALVGGLLLGPRAPWLALVGVVALLGLGAAVLRPALALVAAAALLCGAITSQLRVQAGERAVAAMSAQAGHAFSASVIALAPPRRAAFGGWSVAAR